MPTSAETTEQDKDYPDIQMEDGDVIITFRPRSLAAKRRKLVDQGVPGTMLLADFGALVRFRRDPPPAVTAPPAGYPGFTNPMPMADPLTPGLPRKTLDSIRLLLASGVLPPETMTKVRRALGDQVDDGDADAANETDDAKEEDPKSGAGSDAEEKDEEANEDGDEKENESMEEETNKSAPENHSETTGTCFVLDLVSAGLAEKQPDVHTLQSAVLPHTAAAAPLRSGAEDLVKSVARHSLPLILFTPGVQDVSLQILLSQMPAAEASLTSLALPPSIKVFGNRFDVSPEGKIVGLAEPSSEVGRGWVTEENQDMATAMLSLKSEEAEALQTLLVPRKNAVVLSTSPAGADMSRGAPSVDTVLRVGFAEPGEDLAEVISQFQRADFDVLVLGDGSLGYLTDLLKEIATGRTKGQEQADQQQQALESQRRAQEQAAQLHQSWATLAY